MKPMITVEVFRNEKDAIAYVKKYGGKIVRKESKGYFCKTKIVSYSVKQSVKCEPARELFNI